MFAVTPSGADRGVLAFISRRPRGDRISWRIRQRLETRLREALGAPGDQPAGTTDSLDQIRGRIVRDRRADRPFPGAFGNHGEAEMMSEHDEEAQDDGQVSRSFRSEMLSKLFPGMAALSRQTGKLFFFADPSAIQDWLSAPFLFLSATYTRTLAAICAETVLDCKCVRHIRTLCKSPS